MVAIHKNLPKELHQTKKSKYWCGQRLNSQNLVLRLTQDTIIIFIMNLTEFRPLEKVHGFNLFPDDYILMEENKSVKTNRQCSSTIIG